MPFELTEIQKNIVEAAKKISSKFDDNYWLDLDLKSEFPFEFYNEVAKSGWLGMCMPEEYGGACLLYTSPSPRDKSSSRMPSSA